METSCVFGAAAAIAAFFGGEFCTRAVLRRTRRRRAGEGGIGQHLARNGVRCADGVARRLLSVPKVSALAGDAQAALQGRGVVCTPRSLCSLAVAAAAALAVCVGLVSASPFAGAAVAVLACAVAVARIHGWRDRQEEALREAVPDALHAMGSCFQAGFSLLQTFQQLAGEIKGPLGKRFAACAHLLETGHGSSEALGALRAGGTRSELAFVAVALDVQHQAGGSMRPVLEAARETVEGELALRRALRVQTAQARLSARVVTVMPFALVAVFSLVSKGFLNPFLHSPLGLGLLGLACAMEVAGVLAVRRMLNVEVS
ncbi:type II secretion system F family protein [uncultured Senegalimassilia sp.]|uniref:type II secretion system F family protein n=1 Tax=uncultured Senegalimassilia sp. TaxID=1714350 RepID=UPI0025E3B1D2|nr:type II secretion system F family protein [uncultured Senegalimassilia sp.]